MHRQSYKYIIYVYIGARDRFNDLFEMFGHFPPSSDPAD